jgi:enterochelin esterase-like enzyme
VQIISGARRSVEESAVAEVPYVRQSEDYQFMPDLGRPVLAPVRYAHGPDSEQQAGVPVGELIERTWNQSRVFPGTKRRYWIYIPAQYRADEPASLLVVQDGWYYLDPHSDIRTAIVLDNLIHYGEIPVTIGVFVDPGEFPSEPDPAAKRNRNVEYDTYSDAYATFLLEEVLPTVQQDLRITDDPDRWAIMGGSSGGDCSFTVAWMRPDRFRKVLIFESSWPQVRGADYERLITDTEAKPLRVFMQASTRDIGWWRPTLNWFSSNLRVAAALAERGYDMRLVLGDGPHDPNHAGTILPDALRWLWRSDTQAP